MTKLVLLLVLNYCDPMLIKDHCISDTIECIQDTLIETVSDPLCAYEVCTNHSDEVSPCLERELEGEDV